MQLVKNGIPNFASTIDCLNDFMEIVYDKARGCTKRAVAAVQLDALDWGRKELKAFKT